MSDAKFDQFLKDVDVEIGKLGIPLGREDLRDWGWWDAFDSEMTPENAAKSFLEEVLDEMGFEDLITWERVG